MGLPGLSRRWQVAVYACAGLALGTAAVVARLANAASYLSDHPRTCINCHVMTDAYATWERGSHAQTAVCVDCHVPHENLVAKLAFKSMDGMKHSYVFSLRKEPQVLQLSQRAIPVVQRNCVRCHADQLQMVRLAASTERKCWHCHENIHGAVQSLSASPHVLRPRLPDAGLKWLKQGEPNR
ncbi:MAG: cytochrome c nitrite reductase small subunit [Phycisphaerae bacterium]|nr:cytochrome c nitrite reductase small subunit [Phycisphaerae bacterium]